MPPVFAHGRLRLYLLKLLEEEPRHGYEIMRLLEERFQGLYAPSAGTVYPRLAKLEAEGLVTHSTEGGRKTYVITEAGRAELASRSGELAELEVEIGASLSALAADIREDVHGSANDLRREVREQTRHNHAGRGRRARGAGGPWGGQPWQSEHGDDREAWRQAKEEVRRAKEEWKEQARRAKEEARKARRQAEQEREAHRDAVEEFQRAARRIQGQVQTGLREGDWQSAVRTGMTDFAREMGRFGAHFGTGGTPFGGSDPFVSTPGREGEGVYQRAHRPGEPDPSWGEDVLRGEPARSLERLLDRFRDDVRDAARDQGVDESQLREVRRHLSTAAAHIGAVLKDPDAYFATEQPADAEPPQDTVPTRDASPDTAACAAGDGPAPGGPSAGDAPHGTAAGSTESMWRKHPPESGTEGKDRPTGPTE